MYKQATKCLQISLAISKKSAKAKHNPSNQEIHQNVCTSSKKSNFRAKIAVTFQIAKGSCFLGINMDITIFLFPNSLKNGTCYILP